MLVVSVSYRNFSVHGQTFHAFVTDLLPFIPLICKKKKTFDGKTKTMYLLNSDESIPWPLWLTFRSDKDSVTRMKIKNNLFFESKTKSCFKI